ncbi:AraC family transcriptional regulator [Saccharopolyspora sp. NPDC002686]|uniref:AraC family transcriptional regulator n=1 Tax=Saccharopolyspora sp. NPDC002686 TaxID=3154541 RepID=UPI0033170590
MVWLLPGEALYCGPPLELDPHSGAASCLAIGIDEPLQVTVDGTTSRLRSAFIPPRLTCQVTTTGRIAAFFLEPGSAPERSCSAMMRPVGAIRSDHQRERELAELSGALTDHDVQRWVALATGDDGTTRDERILAAVELLSANPDLSAAHISAQLHLSPSHFLRLFKRDTGTTLRRFRLWARMLSAAAHIADGADLTAAATAAGFASSAHFSSAFHAMFGLSPSKLLSTPLEIRPWQHEAPEERSSGAS